MSDGLRTALDDIDRAMTFDVGECAECDAPPEDGHSDDCSRAPLNALPDARERLRAALATSDGLDVAALETQFRLAEAGWTRKGGGMTRDQMTGASMVFGWLRLRSTPKAE